MFRKIMSPPKIAAAMALFAAASAPTNAAPVYQMTNLTDVIWNTIGAGNDPGFHTRFAATGINDNGTIIGTASLGPLDRSSVVLIDSGLTSSTKFSAGNDGVGRAIQIEGYKVNNNNDFVGAAYVFLNPVTQSPAVSLIFTGGSVGHILDVAPGASNRARAINDSQAVIGNVQAVTYRSGPPFTLGVTTQVPELTGGNYSVEDMNNSGVIVGTKDANIFNGGQGFIDDHGNITLLKYPGALKTYVNGISNDGKIVGTWYDNSNFPHGFVWQGGVFTDIQLPTDPAVYLEGINDSGQIVGEYAFDTGLQADGFLLTPVAGVSVDLPRYIGDLPPPPTVLGPIDDSLIEQYPLKEFRLADVVDVPEPANSLVFAVPLLALALMRRRRAELRVNT
jgi:probable HAF family extracellular repeat protein